MLTVAVNVTCWPTNDGLSDEASAVVVAAGVTVWVSCARTVQEVRGAAAVGRRDRVGPTVSVARGERGLALPLRATLAARVVAPSVNVTVPSLTGLPALVTVAVNVTVWPKVDGFADEARAVCVTAAVADVQAPSAADRAGVGAGIVEDEQAPDAVGVGAVERRQGGRRRRVLAPAPGRRRPQPGCRRRWVGTCPDVSGPPAGIVPCGAVGEGECHRWWCWRCHRRRSSA